MKPRKSRSLAAGQSRFARGAALGVASGQVIAHRLARAAAGDHGESSRMVTEKVGASILSGMAAMQQASLMGMRTGGFVLAEMVRLAAVAQSMAAAGTLESAWHAQRNFMLAWLPRWQDQSASIADAMMQSGDAMLAPVHRVAVANARRLNR